MSDKKKPLGSPECWREVEQRQDDPPKTQPDINKKRIRTITLNGAAKELGENVDDLIKLVNQHRETLEILVWSDYPHFQLYEKDLKKYFLTNSNIGICHKVGYYDQNYEVF